MIARVLLFTSLALLALGCGGKTTVEGKVTSGGKQVVWGSVILVDAAGEYHQGDIELNGTYKVTGVPTGTVKVGVTSPNPTDPRKKSGRPGAGRNEIADDRGNRNPNPRPTPPAGAWFPLPNAEKNSDPMQSGVTAEVKSGKPLDLDVK